jgi:hypothetical protein
MPRGYQECRPKNTPEIKPEVTPEVKPEVIPEVKPTPVYTPEVLLYEMFMSFFKPHDSNPN